jgi:hypothetical protein
MLIPRRDFRVQRLRLPDPREIASGAAAGSRLRRAPLSGKQAG